jgi:hypothetical protein
MHTARWRVPRWVLAGILPIVLAAFALVSASGGPSQAAPAASTAKATVSPATATATAPAGPGAGNLPVAIHNGTCAQPVAEPAYQLGNLAPYASSGATAPPRAMTVQKTIDVNVSDLLSASHHHALVLHESAANYTHYLACGDLAGLPTKDDQAVVVLRPLGGSNWYGIATLAGSKRVPIVGANQTQVTVYLFQAAAPGTPTP